MNYGSNKLNEIKKTLLKRLSEIYDEKEAAVMLNILIEDFFGLSKVQQALNPDYRLSESEMLKLHFSVKELLRHKPVQYITGKVNFAGLDLLVNENVLIPRPETEELVALIVNREKENPPETILDIGTGSGCIALALKKSFSGARITGIDISNKALDVAQKNAIKNSLDVNFINLDITDESRWKETSRFDLIVSNPPYVTGNDKKTMKRNVLDYEPHNALFVPDNNPLIFYKAIINFAKKHLTSNGKLYFEINETFSNEIAKLLTLSGFEKVMEINDFNGKRRFVSGTAG